MNHFLFNTFPNEKYLDWSKPKAFADKKINTTEKMKFVYGRVQNIVGKGEMLVTNIFSFTHNVFTMPQSF